MDIKIKKILEKNAINYKLLEHRTVYTAFTAAETQKINAKGLVKTVLVKFDKPFLLVHEDEEISKYNLGLIAISGNQHLDFKKLEATIKTVLEKQFKKYTKTLSKLPKPSRIKLSLAKEKDITGKLKSKVGLLSPFSTLYELPLFMDKKLMLQPKLIMSAGSYTESLEIKLKDFLKIEQPITGSFSKK
jgi:prolyl-tRNA editing enzyme YbaK/EbsC (Cys-tRNA(Pro) deacylase)